VIILAGFAWDGLWFFCCEICRLGNYNTHIYYVNPAFLIPFGVPGFFLSEKPFQYYSVAGFKK
jgi:hypothetical protein